MLELPPPHPLLPHLGYHSPFFPIVLGGKKTNCTRFFVTVLAKSSSTRDFVKQRAVVLRFECFRVDIAEIWMHKRFSGSDAIVW